MMSGMLKLNVLDEFGLFKSTLSRLKEKMA